MKIKQKTKMKKNIFIIFSFAFFPAILSENEKIFLDGCDGVEKEDPADCHKLGDKNGDKKYPDYCCHVNDGSEKKKCKTVPYSSYRGEITKDYIDNILYTVTCPKGSTVYALEQCGNTFEEAKSLSDCKKYSTFVDSCCYYKTSENNEKSKDFKENSCYWLGSKYEGKINWAGIELECNYKYLNSSLFLIIFTILVLF